jgi:formylglycine-generating enzyme required for sulfatase activity
MINSGRNIVLMLVGVVMVTIGCDVKPLSWAEVLEQNPDPKVVTDVDFLKRITETKLPWRVKDKASGMEMLLVPPGKFMMGASPGDEIALEGEKLAAEKFSDLSMKSRSPRRSILVAPK